MELNGKIDSRITAGSVSNLPGVRISDVERLGYVERVVEDVYKNGWFKYAHEINLSLDTGGKIDNLLKDKSGDDLRRFDIEDINKALKESGLYLVGFHKPELGYAKQGVEDEDSSKNYNIKDLMEKLRESGQTLEEYYKSEHGNSKKKSVGESANPFYFFGTGDLYYDKKSLLENRITYPKFRLDSRITAGDISFIIDPKLVERVGYTEHVMEYVFNYQGNQFAHLFDINLDDGENHDDLLIKENDNDNRLFGMDDLCRALKGAGFYLANYNKPELGFTIYESSDENDNRKFYFFGTGDLYKDKEHPIDEVVWTPSFRKPRFSPSDFLPVGSN